MTQKLMKLKEKLLIMMIVISLLLHKNLAAENFATRFKQANTENKTDIDDFVEKADFDDKLNK